MNAFPQKTVVIVDDDIMILDYLSVVLSGEGFRCETFSQSLAALSYILESNPPTDLLLSDVQMPGMGGIDLLRAATALRPEIPVIIMSGGCDISVAVAAVRAGAADFLLKPAAPGVLAAVLHKYLGRDLRTNQSLIRTSLHRFLSAEFTLNRSVEELKVLMDAIGLKDSETWQHSKRVAEYATTIGREFGLPESDFATLHLGSLLHDIGKVAVPTNILTKPRSLTPSEMTVMQIHPAVGRELLADFPDVEREAELVYTHHERFDGRGYPQGLAGDKIPIFARIFAVADTLDAVTSDRPYRKARSLDIAKAIIGEASGTQFDPKVAEIATQIPDETFAAIRQRFPDETLHPFNGPTDSPAGQQGCLSPASQENLAGPKPSYP